MTSRKGAEPAGDEDQNVGQIIFGRRDPKYVHEEHVYVPDVMRLEHWNVSNFCWWKRYQSLCSTKHSISGLWDDVHLWSKRYKKLSFSSCIHSVYMYFCLLNYVSHF